MHSFIDKCRLNIRTIFTGYIYINRSGQTPGVGVYLRDAVILAEDDISKYSKDQWATGRNLWCSYRKAFLGAQGVQPTVLKGYINNYRVSRNHYYLLVRTVQYPEMRILCHKSLENGHTYIRCLMKI